MSPGGAIRRGRRWRRRVLAVTSLPAALGALLGIEVAIARRGPTLPRPDLGPLDGRLGGPGGNELRVVWLGDSTAAGVGATSLEGTLPRLVARRQPGTVELTVLARSGAQVQDVLDHQVERVGPLRPAVVFVSVGANDTSHLVAPGDFGERYARLLDRLPPDALTVLLGVPDMGAPPRLLQPLRAVAGWRGRQLEGVVRRLAERPGLVYVDIPGETGPAFRRHRERYFAPDGYHPNDAGYALWADAVARALRLP